MKSIYLYSALALTMLTSSAQAAEKSAPLFIQVPQLSLESANKIASATIAACRVKGLNIAVTVVDRFGIPMAMQRDT